jgi:peptidoglycan/xylan/chitin deacetylase (PgdA/CDA1 family)
MALGAALLLALHASAGAPSVPSLPDARTSVPATGQLGVPLKGGGVVTGETKRRLLHFTFDDGPDPDLTPRLLDVLDRVGWKATFFFSTSRFTGRERRNSQAAALAREVARRGHQLGAHGFDHKRMAQMTAAALDFQVKQSEAMFESVYGSRTFLFRPPFGSRNNVLDRMLSEGGYVTSMWNIGMADWNARKPELILHTFWRVLARNEAERGERGGVVLLHDTHAWSVAAFGLIADSIQARNCELLAAGEELYDVAESLAPWVLPMSDDVYAARQAALRKSTEARCTHTVR